jgi:rfaE bifunctional protein kinase chain/domain
MITAEINQSLLKHIPQCRRKTILVIGDIMLDEYHWCKVGRISPEAPVPICTVEKTTLVPGGAANVANNIQALGSVPNLFGVLGNDSSGEKLLQVFKQSHIVCEHILLDDKKPTILKSRIIAHQQHVVRVDRENTSPISQKSRKILLDRAEKLLPTVDALLISDYLKGTLPVPFTQKLIQIAAKHGVKVIVDPKGNNYKKYKGATVITPNFSEFQTIINKQITTEKEILSEGLKLIKKLNLEALLITRSEKGMTVITKDKSKTDIPTMAKEVYDITGAGDTVISVVSIGLAAGLPISEAACLANYAAGIVVGKIGTSTTSFDEIQTVIEKIK